jgi:hypothetical protein
MLDSFNKNRNLFIAVCLFLFLALIVLSFKFAYGDIYKYSVRVTALIGFASLFFSVIFSGFFEEFDKNGKKVLLYHHIFALIGIILITLHPLLLAFDKSDFTIFVPRVDSWLVFWELGGRPSLILLYVGFISGILIRLYNKSYKLLHIITYISLIFGFIHAYLIGTDFQNPFITIVFVLLILIMIYILIDKRYRNKKF